MPKHHGIGRLSRREKRRDRGWNRTDLAKLDEINDISVSDLEFRLPFQTDLSERSSAGFLQVFRSGTYCIVGENGRGKTSLLYLMLGLYSSKGKVKIQRRANRRMRLGLHTCERDIVLPTVVLRAGRNGERAVRVFRHALFSYHRGVDGLLSLENSVKESSSGNVAPRFRAVSCAECTYGRRFHASRQFWY